MTHMRSTIKSVVMELSDQDISFIFSCTSKFSLQKASKETSSTLHKDIKLNTEIARNMRFGISACLQKMVKIPHLLKHKCKKREKLKDKWKKAFGIVVLVSFSFKDI